MGLFKELKAEKITLIALGTVYLVGIASFACFFFLDNPGYPLGWILGGGLSIVCYISIVYGSNAILLGTQNKKFGTSFIVLFGLLRLILLGGALLLAGYYTYKLNSNWLNLWTTFGGMIPLGVVTGVTGLLANKKIKEVK